MKSSEVLRRRYDPLILDHEEAPSSQLTRRFLYDLCSRIVGCAADQFIE
jgi:hypothetical protein